jgi:PPOX class probable F420-dependent enzyme
MDQAAIDAFLSDDRHAILATNGPDGIPQLTPVWFLVEDGRIYVSAQATTVKVYNLRRDPRISLCIDGCRGDERYVVVTGTAELVEPGDPFQKTMRRRIIGKYHAREEAAELYYTAVRDNPAVLIVVTPQKVLSRDFG